MQKTGDFEIVRELGRGAMGIVYEAIEMPLNRRVALKMLHPEWAAQPESYARFIDEARKIAKLSHPGIVKIYRFDKIDACCFLALEYVDGTPLDKVLVTQQLAVDRVVAVLKAVADALGHAHDSGIVHRDIKPGNIFLRKDQGVVLGDFGIAKDLDPAQPGLTTDGTVIGTPAYMSPEQGLLQGHAISPASDVYSLGILAFEMLTGRVPFTADTWMGILIKHANEIPPPILDSVPNLPPTLIELVGAMLEKEPALRPQNGKDVAASLARVQEALDKDGTQEDVTLKERAPQGGGSILEELELTVASFELVGFSRDTCQNMLPARVAFLLENWYRLVRQAISNNGGSVDRYVADRITGLFGYPRRQIDHACRALRAAMEINRTLVEFNKAYDLEMRMRAGIACGPALVGHIVGDQSSTCIQGILPGDMVALMKFKAVDAPIRLNRAAYRRASEMAEFTRFEEARVGEVWATYGA